MPTPENLTLPSADLLIKEYMLKNSADTATEKTFLINIQNRIRAINTAESGWQKFGLIVNGELINQSTTQHDVINQARSIQEKTIGFTWITVSKLLFDVKTEKDNQHSQEYINLLLNIESCLNGVLDSIKNRIHLDKQKRESVIDKIEKVELLNKEQNEFEDIYFSNNEFYEMIQKMGGRILPFNQAYDPLIGKLSLYGSISDSSGSCFGYVQSWCNEISKFGYASTLPRINDEVQNIQMQQSKPITPAWAKDYFAGTDFRILIQQMLDGMRDDKVYGLSFKPQGSSLFGSGHIIGVRSIQSQHSFELFDPNLGTVTFDNRDNFVNFFAYYLCKFNYKLLVNDKTVCSSLYLYSLGAQPSHAKPSLPMLADTKSKEFTSEERSAFLNNIKFTLSDVAKLNDMVINDKAGRDKYRNLGFINQTIDVQLSACLGAACSHALLILLNNIILNIPEGQLSNRLVMGEMIVGSMIGAYFGATTYTARCVNEWILSKSFEGIFKLVELYQKRSADNKQHSISSSGFGLFVTSPADIVTKVSVDHDVINSGVRIHL